MAGEAETEAERGRGRFSQEEEAQAQVDIWKYVLGFTEMAVVKCAVELGIADIIESSENPLTVSELSSELGCAPSSLYRIMRFLIHRGIFKEKSITESSTGYVQTPLSRLLMNHGEHSMAKLVLLESSPVILAPWQGLSACVLASGDSAFKVVHGEDFWHYAKIDPDLCKLFEDAMACGARVTVPAVLNGCPEVFEGLKSLVDVGGGDGTALGLIVKSCPWVRGINFDLPHVVSAAPNWDGVEHVGGDMFSSIPKADAAYIMWVLHDWDDDKCIDILKKCKEAIPRETGKVIIVDAVLERKEEDKFKDVRLMLDMVMMTHTSKGKERTEKEWAYVLHESGFSRYTIKHIQAVQAVIEAYP